MKATFALDGSYTLEVVGGNHRIPPQVDLTLWHQGLSDDKPELVMNYVIPPSQARAIASAILAAATVSR